MVQEVSPKKRSYGFSLNLEQMDKNGTSAEIVRGRSGAAISIELYQGSYGAKNLKTHRLRIENSIRSGVFDANWWENHNGKSNVVCFDIATVNLVTGSRARDFYAGDLVDAYMQFILTRHQVDRVHFFWMQNAKMFKGLAYPSDNYVSYHTAKDRIMAKHSLADLSDPKSLDQIKKQAALQTWTGQRVAKKFGFSEVESIADDYSVKGYFVRPPTEL